MCAEIEKLSTDNGSHLILAMDTKLQWYPTDESRGNSSFAIAINSQVLAPIRRVNQTFYHFKIQFCY